MKIISNNKKAFHDYEILEKYEAGIELQGWEVKTCRANSVDISNAYCSIYKDEVYLKDSFFKQYMLLKCDEYRDRKLLLHKKEIRKLKQKIETMQVTLIPLKLYFSGSYIKLEIALAKGLKKYDKRAKIVKEETQKAIKKALKFY
ncbi:SsrA-binding protein [Mycoplasmopsis gallopavonis]|uniref:SsrA-binding protein n=1 Tax=Mycoplasmopsis gallopavonis TaxID=76629 RepID=A0A449B097_9BACT|nr:SsrA-binding protein [Mycoplasmopsis gallopavonis]RIV16365.1 SsrA-binding protein [Mycoplasmopsis gallopavonis]VEU73185.1 SsrA RNA (tmRNA)-binding protein [Mycoplasmopsis gallopavonis]